MSETRKPFWIGAFLLSGLVLLAGGLLLLGRDQWFGQPRDYVVYFSGALDGLAVGSAVTYRGIRVGSVHEIRLAYDERLEDLVIPVVVRFDADAGAGGQRFDRLVEPLVARGLRAQLQTQSLLTGQAIVALDLYPDRAGYVREPNETNLPAIPSIPSRIDQAADLLRELADSLRNLPLREMVESASRTLQAVERLARAPETHDALVTLSATLTNLEQVTRQLQRQLPPILEHARQGGHEWSGALVELRQTAQTLQQTLVQIQTLAGETRHNLGQESEAQFQLLEALQQLSRASKALQRTAEDLQQRPESLIFGKKR